MAKVITFDRFVRMAGIGLLIAAIFCLINYLSSVLIPFLVARILTLSHSEVCGEQASCSHSRFVDYHHNDICCVSGVAHSLPYHPTDDRPVPKTLCHIKPLGTRDNTHQLHFRMAVTGSHRKPSTYRSILQKSRFHCHVEERCTEIFQCAKPNGKHHSEYCGFTYHLIIYVLHSHGL